MVFGRAKLEKPNVFLRSSGEIASIADPFFNVDGSDENLDLS